MVDSLVDLALQKAQEKCNQSGSRLTEKRKIILGILLKSEKPLSAYEVADHYNKLADQSMPPMSAYRILDFLSSEELVHKLSSANKYVACSHIACDHPHQIPQFLICRKCHKVKEVGIQKKIIDELSKTVNAAGFKLMNSQLELDCVCGNCLESQQ